MKSMTDFIMEQEMPSVEEEVFNESALVSQFMAVQAAAAEMNCIYEYASIATFCESNDIEMPEMLVQEGFKDVMNNIWTAISNFFTKIAEWFKSLVKGTVATFSAAKLNEIIAKLRTYPGDTKVSDKKIVSAAVVYIYIVGALEGFKEYVIHPVMDAESGEDSNNDDQKIQKDFLDNLKGYTEDLEKLKETSNWKTAEGTFTDKFKLTTLEKYVDTSVLSIDTIRNNGDVNYEWLIDVLETVNRLNIPKSGTELLKALNASDKNFKKLVNGHKGAKADKITFKAGDNFADIANDNNVSPEEFKKKLTAAGITITDGKIDADGTVDNVPVGKKWVTNADVKTNVTKAANALATVYDKAKTGISETAALVFKDLKKAEGDAADTEYQNALKELNGAAGTGAFTKSSSALSNEAKGKIGLKQKP